jgi:nucleotidyltransferase AbiEii toxin of type IV toxin-antitoxin system
MSQFKPHMEILPARQQQLWRELKPSVRLGLVLYGGTAIGLRLGHRPSVDFDFFTDKPLERATLDDAFPFLKKSIVLQQQPHTLTVLVPAHEGESHRTPEQGVKLSFFGNLDFGRIDQPDLTEDGVLNVASLDDLMATKLKVLLQRIEAKDYKDIAAMLEAGVSLARGLAGASEMYKGAFQSSESLKALVYFEGGDLDLLTKQEKEVLIGAAQKVRDLPSVNRISELSSGEQTR